MHRQIQKPKRRHWSAYEDKILLFLKQEKKLKRWTYISQEMKNEYNIKYRSEKQCRDRYENNLKFRGVSKNSHRWTAFDDQKLLSLYYQNGNRWSQIAEKFPTHINGNYIKNKFYSRIRKAIRTINIIIKYHFNEQYPLINLNIIYKLDMSLPLSKSTVLKYNGKNSKQSKQIKQAKQHYRLIRNIMTITLKSKNNYHSLEKLQNPLGQNDEKVIKDIIRFLLVLQNQQTKQYPFMQQDLESDSMQMEKVGYNPHQSGLELYDQQRNIKEFQSSQKKPFKTYITVFSTVSLESKQKLQKTSDQSSKKIYRTLSRAGYRQLNQIKVQQPQAYHLPLKQQMQKQLQKKLSFSLNSSEKPLVLQRQIGKTSFISSDTNCLKHDTQEKKEPSIYGCNTINNVIDEKIDCSYSINVQKLC